LNEQNTIKRYKLGWSINTHAKTDENDLRQFGCWHVNDIPLISNQQKNQNCINSSIKDTITA